MLKLDFLSKKSQKKANTPAGGDLKKILNVLQLDDTVTYWEIKK